jgi:hypothetical protein
MKYPLTLFCGLLVLATSGQAGSLTDGQWQPSHCGQKSPMPEFDWSNTDSYIISVQKFNSWETKAQEYNNCLAKEANEDNATITKSANATLDAFQKEADMARKEADAAKAMGASEKK